MDRRTPERFVTESKGREFVGCNDGGVRRVK